MNELEELFIFEEINVNELLQELDNLLKDGGN